MSFRIGNGKTGYTRREFNALYQIYSAHVYSGFFRNFSFTETKEAYRMDFNDETGKLPLISIEKRALGPDRVLYTAQGRFDREALIEIGRSEKLDSFIQQVKTAIERMKTSRTIRGGGRGSNVVSLTGTS